MSRDSCQALRWSMILCATAAACEGSHSSLLGEYVAAGGFTQTSAPEAATLLGPHDAGPPMPMPKALAAGSALTPAPTPPSAQPSTTPPPASLKSPNYVARAAAEIEQLEPGIEQYICVTTDLTLSEDAWVTALEVVPQHPDYTFRATVSFAQDGACDGLGISAHNVFDYYPSNHRIELSAGDALLLPALSRINVQLHYSGLAATAPSTDTQLTEVRLWTLPKGERPKREVVRAMFHVLNISIPVDATDVKTTMSAEIEALYTRPGAEIIGIAPGVHYLGQHVTASLLAPDGTESTILDLLDWHLDSRKDYLLDPSKYIPVPSGSIHKHSCVYSNRLEDQALDAHGSPFTPRLTTFGEDARSEQCRMNVMFRYPI